MSWLQLQLVVLTASVIKATSVTPCDPSKGYELKSLCCDLCPAGSFVSRHCDVDHGTQCLPCPPGTFTAHSTSKTECMLCSQCRKADQEMVSDCTRDSDRQCQCKPNFYCDSADCMESCYSCTRCKGTTLQTCNATRDTICATDTHPEPANPTTCSAVSFWLVLVVLFVGNIVGITIILVVCFLRRRETSHESGSNSRNCSEPIDTLLPRDTERGPPAPCEGTTPLMQEEVSAVVPGAGTCPAPSEEPGDGTELQVVFEGIQAAPEQALRTPAPAAHRPQGQAEVAASLSHLEQKFKQKYFLKETSYEASISLYYEFEHQVPASDWKMFMRLVGLEENDIEICEHENPVNLKEQRHKMLLRWKNRLGSDASPFRLMAALHKMDLHVCLQNIINNLIAENILGKHAETPN